MISRFGGARIAWGLALVLALAVGLEMVWPDGTETALPPGAQSRADPVSGQAAESIGAWTMAILARPLFNPDRRPSNAVTAAGPARRDDLPRLAGILVLPGGRQAIFAPAGDATRSIVATEGTLVGAWKVMAISPMEVQLAGPDGTLLVRPSYANGPSAPLPLAVQAVPAPQGILLPPAPTDTRPFESVVQPSGASIFSHMLASPAARSP